MSVQEQAIQMINNLSDENVKYLIDFIQRFMIPNNNQKSSVLSSSTSAEDTNFIQEMEAMRIHAKAYFPSDFDSNTIWEEAINKKYNFAN